MRLIFINGWGFDKGVWDSLASALPQFQQQRIDLGFFDNASHEKLPDAPCILIGHSLGFVHGMRMQQNWAGWVAINSFPRFLASDQQPGCVPPAALAQMKKQLQRNPQKTLADFYHLIGAKEIPTGEPNSARLQDGLDELRDANLHGFLQHKKPALVLAAHNDPLVPIKTSEALATALKADLQFHATGGHMLPQQDAEGCAKALTQFIATKFQQ